MGISTIYGALLVRAREKGTTFGSVATIGRQSLAVPLEDMKRFALRLGLSISDCDAVLEDGYAEGFLSAVLGAERVTSFDYSSYQGVDVVHDFNRPLDEAYHQTFDTLIDGGSMEHIFDIRCVLSNYMSMVNLGGSIFIHVPSNNLMGHGFYQFSAELFYRVFSADNGFTVEEACLTESPFQAVEVSASQRCYLTCDPASIGKRIRLVNDRPVMLYVHARRTELVPIFRSSPMQSDFSDKWAAHDARDETGAGGKSSKHSQTFSAKTPFRYASWKEELRRGLVQRRKYSLKNRRFFQRLYP